MNDFLMAFFSTVYFTENMVVRNQINVKNPFRAVQNGLKWSLKFLNTIIVNLKLKLYL